MQRFFITISTVLVSTVAISQARYDNNLMLGRETNGSLPSELYSLNFMNVSEEPFEYYQGYFNLWYSSTAISDSLGNLIFYTNGCQVANSNHELMVGGDSLNVGPVFYNFNCVTPPPTLRAYNSGTQSIMSMPKPNFEDQYYIFHLRKDAHPAPDESSWVVELHSTTIDMTKNNGLGEVVEKNESILNEPLAYGSMTAVRHQDGERWWLKTNGYDSNEHIFVLIGENGKDTVVRQQVGPIIQESSYITGQTVFSPNGEKMAHTDEDNHLLIFDFDRTTGQLSEPEQIFLNDREETLGGVCFSSNNRFLYAASIDTVYQFDLAAPNIAASKTVVMAYGGNYDSPPVTFYQMERGPDCKIYINSLGITNYLHVILYPDRPGTQCEARQHHLIGPNTHDRNLLNAPNYRLGTPYPTCDSTLNVVTSTNDILPTVGKYAEPGFEVFPNPAGRVTTVRFPEPVSGIVEVLDPYGIVRQTEYANGEAEVDLSLEHLARGAYLVRVRYVDGRMEIQQLVKTE